jgi:hypothetical protein
MRQVTLPLPELGLIAATRAMLGAGIALLAADCMTQQQRRAVGWTLFSVGVITTLPLAAEVISQARLPAGADRQTPGPRRAAMPAESN